GVSLWFQPTQERFSIKATALPETGGSLEIQPPGAKEVTLAISGKEAKQVFNAKPGHEPLWKIDTGGASVSLDIKGLTSWSQWGGFALEDHGFFSFHKEAYLPVADLRWVLTPYQTIRELVPAAQKGELAWRMH